MDCVRLSDTGNIQLIWDSARFRRILYIFGNCLSFGWFFQYATFSLDSFTVGFHYEIPWQHCIHWYRLQNWTLLLVSLTKMLVFRLTKMLVFRLTEVFRVKTRFTGLAIKKPYWCLNSFNNVPFQFWSVSNIEGYGYNGYAAPGLGMYAIRKYAWKTKTTHTKWNWKLNSLFFSPVSFCHSRFLSGLGYSRGYAAAPAPVVAAPSYGMCYIGFCFRSQRIL